MFQDSLELQITLNAEAVCDFQVWIDADDARRENPQASIIERGILREGARNNRSRSWNGPHRFWTGIQISDRGGHTQPGILIALAGRSLQKLIREVTDAEPRSRGRY
jgi:hypothetical protein